jgi:outer membrane protein insertion porin family
MVGCVLFFSLGMGAFAQESGPTVQEIELKFVGPQTVHKSIVTANIRTVVGKPRSQAVVEQDVRDLIATGYFYDVRVLEESVPGGVKVIYQLQGMAKVSEITIEGNRKYNADRLKRELALKPGDILNEHKVHGGVKKMRELYQKAGYPDVRVDYFISRDKDTGRALVRIQVDEGPRVFIKKIDFHGNNAYTDARLHKLWKTRHRWWGSWLANTGVLRDAQ